MSASPPPKPDTEYTFDMEHWGDLREGVKRTLALADKANKKAAELTELVVELDAAAFDFIDFMSYVYQRKTETET